MTQVEAEYKSQFIGNAGKEIKEKHFYEYRL